MKNHPAKKIYFLLSTYGLSRRQMAEKLGISLESMNELMDENQAVLPHVVKKISRVFGLADDFFKEELIEARPAVQDPARADAGHPRAEEVSKRDVLTLRYRAYPHKVVAKRTRKR